MNKTILSILVILGIVVLYILALIIATAIVEYIFIKGDSDDLDYAMTANVIQFFVMVVIIAEKVTQWIN